MAVLGTILRVVIAIAAVFVIYRGAMVCYDYGYRIFTEPAVSSGEGRTITVAITENMSVSEIGELFENKGLVRDAGLFTIQYYLSEFRKDVKPGVFELSTSMTAEEMMEAMAAASPKDTEESGGDTSGTAQGESGATGAAGSSGSAEGSGAAGE